MNTDKLWGIVAAMAVTVGVVYSLITGKPIPPGISQLFEQDKKAVIRVGRHSDLVSNDLTFMVGECLYLHLHTEGYVPHYVSWKLESQPVQQGLRFNTCDIDEDIDLKALQQSTISRGSFRIEAVFLNDKNEHVTQIKDIAFIERDEPPRRQTSSQSQRGRSDERDEPTGSISYKGDEVIGNNNDICTLAQNGAYKCPY